MGIGFSEIANDLYRSKIDHISVSELKLFNYSPYRYKYQYLDKNQKSATKSQSLGTLFHLALLEPKVFDESVRPFKDLRTSKALEAKGAGFIVARTDDYEAVIEARDAVLKNEYVKSVLATAKTEASVFWRWPGTDIDCKCRFDIVNVDQGIILDVKTCQSLEKFENQVDFYGYDVQAAFYTQCAESFIDKKFKFQFLAVEMEAPYLFKIYEVTPELAFDAHTRCYKMLMDFKAAKQSNYFPHPSEEVGLLYPRNSKQVMYQEISEVTK